MAERAIRISNPSARRLLRRAVDKAEALRQAGTFIVVDGSGAPVSAVRMDGCAPGALAIVRAKAFGAAVNGEPSARFAERMAKFSPAIFAAYQQVMREQPFPGGGAVLIDIGGHSVGAMATGLGIGPFVKLPGVAPGALIADGKPTNLEDLVISYALGTAYSPQHGDDLKRWIEAYGEPPAEGVSGTALAQADPASKQRTLDRALAIADFAMAAAESNTPVAVAVVDASGDVICLDRMDGAAPMGVDVAAAVATAAINFAMPSAQIANAYPDREGLRALMDAVPYKMLALPGGHPIEVNGQVMGAIGLFSVDPRQSETFAAQAAEWAQSKFQGDHE